MTQQTKFAAGDELMYLDPKDKAFKAVRIRRNRPPLGQEEFYEIEFTTGRDRFAITHAIGSQLYTQEEAENYGKDGEGDSEG